MKNLITTLLQFGIAAIVAYFIVRFLSCWWRSVRAFSTRSRGRIVNFWGVELAYTYDQRCGACIFVPLRYGNVG